MPELADLKFKILIVGDWGVGKTSLVRNFVERKFFEDYLPSIGVNLLVKEIEVDFQGMKVTVTLTIWDLAGHESFRPLMPAYNRGANGVFFVGDLTRIRSFENITLWYQDLSTNLEEQIPVVFLANKNDLEHYIDENYIAETAASVGAVAVYKTSAKTGENVQAAFEALVLEMLTQYAGQHPDCFSA